MYSIFFLSTFLLLLLLTSEVESTSLVVSSSALAYFPRLPVYKFYNNKDKIFFYSLTTTVENENNNNISSSFVYDGIAFYTIQIDNSTSSSSSSKIPLSGNFTHNLVPLFQMKMNNSSNFTLAFGEEEAQMYETDENEMGFTRFSFLGFVIEMFPTKASLEVLPTLFPIHRFVNQQKQQFYNQSLIYYYSLYRSDFRMKTGEGFIEFPNHHSTTTSSRNYSAFQSDVDYFYPILDNDGSGAAYIPCYIEYSIGTGLYSPGNFVNLSSLMPNVLTSFSSNPNQIISTSSGGDIRTETDTTSTSTSTTTTTTTTFIENRTDVNSTSSPSSLLPSTATTTTTTPTPNSPTSSSSPYFCSNTNLFSSLEIKDSERKGWAYGGSQFIDIYNPQNCPSCQKARVEWVVNASELLKPELVLLDENRTDNTTNSSQYNEEDIIDFYFVVDYSTYINLNSFPNPVFHLRLFDSTSGSDWINPSSDHQQPLYFRPPDTTKSNSDPKRRFLTIGQKFTNLHKFSQNMLNISLRLDTPNAYWGMYLYRILILGVPRNNNSNTVPPLFCPSSSFSCDSSSSSNSNKNDFLKMYFPVNTTLLSSKTTLVKKSVYDRSIYKYSIQRTLVAFKGFGGSTSWKIPASTATETHHNHQDEVESRITIEYCKGSEYAYNSASSYYDNYFYPTSSSVYAQFSFKTTSSNNGNSTTLSGEEEEYYHYLPHYNWSTIDTTDWYNTMTGSNIRCSNYTLPVTFPLRQGSTIKVTALTSSPLYATLNRFFFLISSLKIEPVTSPTSTSSSTSGINEAVIGHCLDTTSGNDANYVVVPTPVPWTYAPWTPPSSDSSTGSSSLSGGAIAGIISGSFVGLVITSAVIGACIKKSKAETRTTTTTADSTTPPPITTDDSAGMEMGATSGAPPSVSYGGGYAARDYDQVQSILANNRENPNNTNLSNQDAVFVLGAAIPFGGAAIEMSPSNNNDESDAPPPPPGAYDDVRPPHRTTSGGSHVDAASMGDDDEEESSPV